MKTPPLSVEPFDTANVTLFLEGGERPHWYRFPKEIDGYIEHLRPAAGKRPTKSRAQRSSEWLHSYHQGNVRWSIDEVVGLCPYGIPGNRLWVRETWQNISYREAPEESCILYRADGEEHPPGVFWRPSIFMPRVFSRITLEIAEVRVQRLQEISEEDAKTEGLACVTKDGSLWKYGIPDRDGLPGNDDYGWKWQDWESDPRRAYRRLWESINGPESWDANPWVWAITFSRFQP